MLKKMNLPNKLTMLRIFLVPLFVVFMCLPIDWVWPMWTAFGIYVVASFTDFLDGYISRKYNMITKFGKIMDPLADKLLVSAGFVMLTGLNIIPAWITMIILFRDLFVTALRNFGADNSSDLGAIFSGKLKTVFQLVGILLAIAEIALFESNTAFGAFLSMAVNMSPIQLMINVLMTILISAAVIATIWSLVDYFLKFKKDINVEE